MQCEEIALRDKTAFYAFLLRFAVRDFLFVASINNYCIVMSITRLQPSIAYSVITKASSLLINLGPKLTCSLQKTEELNYPSIIKRLVTKW